LSFEPEWLESSLDRYYAWGLVFMGVLLVGFPLYKIREPALRRAAMQEQQVSYAKVGAVLFQQHCSACHGAAGTGGSVGPTLYSKEFLESTSDTQIGWLITGGISGTVMSAYGLDFGGPLTQEQVRQVVVYMRTWEPTAPSLPAWRTGEKVALPEPLPDSLPVPAAVAESIVPPPTQPVSVADTSPQAPVPAVPSPQVTRGSQLFGQFCIACHGVNGVGGLGPTLNAKEYLAGATDEHMRQVITHGVAGTSMVPWGAAGGGMLKPADVDVVITYIRSWTPTAPSVPGWKKGRPPKT
jgi:mono/diheme cytochrome c family protein